MATYEQVTYNSDDGALIGNSSTEKIGFYGETPVVQYPDLTAASSYITMRQSTGTASTVGLNSEAAMSSLVVQVSSIIQCLKSIGIAA